MTLLARPIALAGMPGAGKSVVGRALAKRLGGVFVDTDRLIEDAHGRPIGEIFASLGEDAFRDMEEGALSQACAADVISLGGGAPLRRANRELLRERAWVVYLSVSPQTARIRLEGDSTRPLLANGFSSWERLHDERAEVYVDVADVTVSVDRKRVSRIVSEIRSAALDAGVLKEPNV